jgi:protein SCO1/2
MKSQLPKWRDGAMAWGLACALLAGATTASAHGLEQHTDANKGQHKDAVVGSMDYKRSESAYAMPDVVLVDADERQVKLRELMATKDPVMVNFIFTSCSTICPVMAHVFAEMPAVLGANGKRLRMVSISIDPEADTPLQLKAYAKSLKATERWTFLTGTSEDIKSVQLAFAAYRGNKMNHEPLTLMRATAGMPWIRIDGFASPDALAREYKRMLNP